jgi:RNA polymerase sigma-70 factor (ECF subfamily)
LEWLVTEYHTQAIRVAFLITGDLQMAEDVVQDAFFNAYRYIDGFDDNRSFRPWFMRSVSNLAVQTAKKETNKLTLDTGPGDVDLMELLTSEDQPIEEQIESSEFKDKLWHTIQQLTPRQRAAVVQRYFLEMNEKEMAAKLGVAPGTVKWLLNTARQKLRARLGSARNKP